MQFAAVDVGAEQDVAVQPGEVTSASDDAAAPGEVGEFAGCAVKAGPSFLPPAEAAWANTCDGTRKRLGSSCEGRAGFAVDDLAEVDDRGAAQAAAVLDREAGAFTTEDERRAVGGTGGRARVGDRERAGHRSAGRCSCCTVGGDRCGGEGRDGDQADYTEPSSKAHVVSLLRVGISPPPWVGPQGFALSWPQFESCRGRSFAPSRYVSRRWWHSRRTPRGGGRAERGRSAKPDTSNSDDGPG